MLDVLAVDILLLLAAVESGTPCPFLDNMVLPQQLAYASSLVQIFGRVFMGGCLAEKLVVGGHLWLFEGVSCVVTVAASIIGLVCVKVVYVCEDFLFEGEALFG